MIMNTQRIAISRLTLNQGQIDGLPANPRQWTREDIDKIAASLKETPELFEMRPCIVTPHKDQFVILAGSLRFCGARQNGDADVPCIVFEGDAEKMKEIVIKDNGSWGAWDMDSLANEWDDLPLAKWGVPAWVTSTPADESALDDLFEEHADTKEKDIVISIEIPQSYEDKVEDIRASLTLTLDEWKGCRVK